MSGLQQAEASDASPTSKVNTYALIGLVSAAITLYWNPFGLPANAGAVGFVQGKGMRVGRGASVVAIVAGVLGIAWAAYYYSI